ncbi:MAG TPA: FmdB family zinc ribbon protein, partial [Candidatus Dormibacteraeota bacterium]|nr:FmdB family zinc ribbon protein [Candidatus Dormibacteraeota bacterium]
MPTYGYRCSNCGHEFEILQRITDEPLKTCPKCQGKLTKKLYPVGISFKGSGFYTTDYKGSATTAGASSNGSVKSSEGGSEGASESKPESKTESKTESKSETKSSTKSDSKTEKKAS